MLIFSGDGDPSHPVKRYRIKGIDRLISSPLNVIRLINKMA
jgi:hypothetical protein